MIVVTNVAGRAEAHAGLGIHRDQRLVADVVDRGEVVELTAREPRHGPEEAPEDRLLAGVFETLVQPVAVLGPDRSNQGHRPVSQRDGLARVGQASYPPTILEKLADRSEGTAQLNGWPVRNTCRYARDKVRPSRYAARPVTTP